MGMTNRQRLREAIAQTGRDVDAAADSVSRLAIELSSRFPQSGLTIDAIEEEIRGIGRQQAEHANTADALR